MQYRATKFQCAVDMAGSTGVELSRLLRRVAKAVDAGALGDAINDPHGQRVGEWTISVERVSDAERSTPARHECARVEKIAVVGTDD